MVDKSAPPDGKTTAPEAATTPPVPPKRGPGHRGAEVKDTVAEMAAKAHEISLEAGSRMAAAMKDVINAAAGLTGFVLESARDLVQYMVRRGQMTQEEADKLIRQAEEAHAGRKGAHPQLSTPAPQQPASTKLTPVVASSSPEEDGKGDRGEKDTVAKKGGEKKPATKTSASKLAGKAPAKSAGKGHEKAPEKPAAKKTSPKPATAKKATTKRK